MAEYYLVTDSIAAEVERLTGLTGRDTPFGVLIKKPKPFDLHRAMAEVNRALQPKPRCTCGAWAIIHGPTCPAGNMMT